MTRLKTDDETAATVRKLDADGLSYREISKSTGVAIWTVRDICQGKSHQNRARTKGLPVAPRVLDLLTADSPQRIMPIAKALNTSTTNVNRALMWLWESGKVNRKQVPGTTGAFEWSACGAPQHPMLKWGLEARA